MPDKPTTKAELDDRLKAIVHSVLPHTPLNTIRPESTFDEIGLNAEEEFALGIAEEELYHLDTYGELLNCIADKLNLE